MAYYQPLFQQPAFLVQPATNRFQTLNPVYTVPTYQQPAYSVVQPAVTPAVMVTTTVQPVMLQQPASYLYPTTMAQRPAPNSKITIKFVIHGKRASLGDCIEIFTTDFENSPSKDQIIERMEFWAARAGWKKKKALPEKAQLYLMKSLGAVAVEDGKLKVEEAEVLSIFEMGVERSDNEWQELLGTAQAKSMAVVVDMDNTIPGFEEEDEVDAVEEGTESDT
ncbi:hypothetical protein CC79DRAFT_1371543 [Sarocladium strictum]